MEYWNNTENTEIDHAMHSRVVTTFTCLIALARSASVSLLALLPGPVRGKLSSRTKL